MPPCNRPGIMGVGSCTAPLSCILFSEKLFLRIHSGHDFACLCTQDAEGGDGAGGPVEGHHGTAGACSKLQHLPPLCLHLTFPQLYPSEEPPHFHLSALWLSAAAALTLAAALEQRWEEQVRSHPAWHTPRSSRHPVLCAAGAMQVQSGYRTLCSIAPSMRHTARGGRQWAGGALYL